MRMRRNRKASMNWGVFWLALWYFSLCFGAGACTSAPKVVQENQYEGSLTEIMRAGVPQNVEKYPESWHLTSHTCTSIPLYSITGEYVRSDIRCH